MTSVSREIPPITFDDKKFFEKIKKTGSILVTFRDDKFK